MRVDVLGVAFDNVTMDEAVERAMGFLEEDGPHLAATPNPEIVQRANQDPEYAEILRKADLVIPDGIGVVYAAKILGRPLKGRVPGVDLALALMGRMAGAGRRKFVLGAHPAVAEQAAVNLQAK
ncbi:MAG: WecB/TagA/CpsF family glycosyltransferase [Oscillospiraceae bacterium]|nr:WecB/TagA/CpsF family glycosyltransferase [Oscillospiraceae bacterium]